MGLLPLAVGETRVPVMPMTVLMAQERRNMKGVYGNNYAAQ
jgi:hypothetical protein